MKKFIGLGVFLLAMTLASADVFAWYSHRGVEWVKDPSRDATIDSVDAAQYNPAGLVQLADGFYGFIGNTFTFKTYSVTMQPLGTSTDSTPALLSPNISLAYVLGNGALFFTYDVIGGGGTVSYENPVFLAGLAGGAISRATLYEAKQALTIGVSYGLFNKMLSFSTGIRYIIHDKEATAKVQNDLIVHATAQLTGWAPFLGINIQPNRMFNVGIVFQPTIRKRGSGHDHISGQSYDTANGVPLTSLIPTTLTVADKNDEYENGYLSIGLGLRPIDNLTVQLSFQWDFQGQRWYGAANGPVTAMTIENMHKRNEYEIALGFEYTLGLIRPSLGFIWDRTDGTSSSNATMPWDPDISSFSVGLGFSIVPNDTLRIDVGVLKAFYSTGFTSSVQPPNGVQMVYRKDVWQVAIGIGVHI